MGKGPEQTFFSNKAYRWPKAHEKMFNITNQQENANQNHHEI